MNDSLSWHLDAYPQSVFKKYTWTSPHTIDYLIVPEYATITVEKLLGIVYMQMNRSRYFTVSLYYDRKDRQNVYSKIICIQKQHYIQP